MPDLQKRTLFKSLNLQIPAADLVPFLIHKLPPNVMIFRIDIPDLRYNGHHRDLVLNPPMISSELINASLIKSELTNSMVSLSNNDNITVHTKHVELIGTEHVVRTNLHTFSILDLIDP